MRRLLVVSPLDVLGSANSRTHHVVRHLALRFDETFSISRMNITHSSRSSKWKALLTMRMSQVSEGAIRWISLSPLLNIRHGLGLHVLGLSTPYDQPPGKIRRLLRRVLSTAGIVPELAVVPSLLLTYMIKVRKRVDVFIGQGPWEILVGVILRAVGRVSLVVYDDIDYAPGFQPISVLRQRVLEYVEQFGVRRADRVISVGDRLASLRRSQGAVQVTVIPNGADIDAFSAARSLRKARAQRRPTIIYAGFLGQWSGIDMALRALAIAVLQVPSLRMVLLGHGAPEDIGSVTSLVTELGLQQVVEYRGESAYRDLPGHFADADIGIALFRPVKLRQYAFSLKAVEYMAAGLPVITTEGTETADLVRRYGSGVAVPFDAVAAAGAIVGMLMDSDAYRTYAENAVARSAHYAWSSLMERYYATVCPGSGDGSR